MHSKNYKQEKQDKMTGWYHELEGHEFEQAPGVGNGQGSLACYSPWGHKELDTAERLNNNSSTTYDRTLVRRGLVETDKLSAITAYSLPALQPALPMNLLHLPPQQLFQ